MGHACCPDDLRGPGPEHPIVAMLAVIAIALAIVLITWVKLELHGTAEIEDALAEQTQMLEPGDEAREAAIGVSRFATGFSP